jgi:hypothetical protein
MYKVFWSIIIIDYSNYQALGRLQTVTVVRAWTAKFLQTSWEIDSKLGLSLGAELALSLGDSLGLSLGEELGPVLGTALRVGLELGFVLSLGDSLGLSLGEELGPVLGTALRVGLELGFVLTLWKIFHRFLFLLKRRFNCQQLLKSTGGCICWSYSIV